MRELFSWYPHDLEPKNVWDAIVPRSATLGDVGILIILDGAYLTIGGSALPLAASNIEGTVICIFTAAVAFAAGAAQRKAIMNRS